MLPTTRTHALRLRAAAAPSACTRAAARAAHCSAPGRALASHGASSRRSLHVSPSARASAPSAFSLSLGPCGPADPAHRAALQPDDLHLPLSQAQASQRLNPFVPFAFESSDAPSADGSTDKPRRTRRKKSDPKSEPDEAGSRSTPDGARSLSDAGSAASAQGSGQDAPPAGGDSQGDDGNNGSKPPAAPPQPDNFPQVLALPITSRPLFPSHRKVVVVTDPKAMSAIEKVAKSPHPWVGAFLLKDNSEDTDIITSREQVHPVGVFCRIVSTWHSRPAAPRENGSKSTSSAPPEGDKLSVLLIPLRRIAIEDVFMPGSITLPSPVDTTPAESSAEPATVQAPSEQATSQTGLEAEATSQQTENQAAAAAPATAQEESVTDSAEPSTETETESTRQALTGQVQLLHKDDVSMVQVHNFVLEPYDLTSSMKSKMNEIISTLNSYWNLTSRTPASDSNLALYKNEVSPEMLSDPERLCDFVAAISGIESGLELQKLLSSRHIEERLTLALNTAQKDLMNLEIQIRFSRETDQKTQKRHKEYVLQEQMKQIKKELGTEAEKETLVAKFQAKADSLNMPEAARKAFDEELSKFRSPENQSHDSNVSRNYLEWLTSLPWGITTKERLSTKNAQQVLDRDHFGLKDVKDRILEFLAVGQLKGSIQGKIICLHGPPGVGKTSIGKSIARATDRKFFRFSLGGLGDYAEIKGHRRTYVAAMPGKAVQALKSTQSENPVILLDEVDKVGAGRAHGGDPSAALLEMLDPEQNHNFLDHYLDVPVDLSRVLFVCTANDASRIPRPLWDRMEAIEVTSYTPAEQFEIAKGYLIPSAMEENGLQGGNITMPDHVVKHLLEGYIRESGVRGLQKTLNKVYRKIAYRLVTQYGDVLEEQAAAAAKAEEEAEATAKAQAESQPAQANEAEQNASEESKKDTDVQKTPESEKKEVEPLIKRLNLPADFALEISEKDVHDFLGPPWPNTDRLFPSIIPAGVSNGLAYTESGAGTLTPIEATLMPGSGQVRLTGHLGQVIQESAQLALSWVKSNANLLGVDPAWMEKQDLHVHMPEGQTPKDGPSAGVALITCLVSLVLQRSVPHTLAMTGEASLRGMVLPVGGLKEKLIAAHRNGMKTLVLPAAVQPRVDTDVAKEVRDSMEIHYVHDVFSALHHVFGPGPWSVEAARLAGERSDVNGLDSDPYTSPHPSRLPPMDVPPPPPTA